MGNFNRARELAAQAPEREAADRKRQAEKDKMFPPMERPCGTPGAVYTIVVSGRKIGCMVTLPFAVEDAIPASATEAMKRALHDAALPIVEKFYRDVWADTLAGKLVKGDPEPLPKRWELLFAKWLRRCVDREEQPMLEGKRVWNKHSIPDAYREDWR